MELSSKQKIVKCYVCEKEFIATIKKIGRGSETAYRGSGTKSRLTSPDGVLLERRNWLCNGCYELMIQQAILNVTEKSTAELLDKVDEERFK